MRHFAVLLATVGVLASLSCSQPSVADDKTQKDTTGASDGAASRSDAPPEKVIKSDAEWRRILTPEQFWVTRQKGTERANTGAYAHYRGKGTFACVGCGTVVFDARHKFESGTGWPSFYRPLDPRRITTEEDRSLFEVRTEVNCATCGAHLGHVFDDGPRPTGLRFCINSVALKLNKPAPAPKAKAKAAATPKSPAGPAVKARSATQESTKHEG